MEKDLPVENIRPTQGMTMKVFKGSFWVLTGQVLPLIATFVSTPFIIRYLGAESYGVLILVGLISGYFSFADFGMGLASTRFASEAFAKADKKEEGLVVRTAAVIAFLSSLIIAIPMFLFSNLLVHNILHVPVNLQTKANIALKITSFTFLFSILGNIFNSPQLSRMRMDINVLITSGSKVLMILITPLVLYMGGGIVEATIVAFFAALIIMGGNIIASGLLLPELYRSTISRSLLRPLIKFGSNVLLWGIAVAVLANLEKLILTRVISVKSLAYYSVAFTLANMTTMLSMSIVQALIPAFSQLQAPEKRTELNTLFSRSIRFSLAGLLPSIIFLLIIAKPFFTIWAGPEFGKESIFPFYFLLVGIFFSIIVYVPNCVLTGFGRADIFARVYWIEMLPYIVIAFLLIHLFGIWGAAISWSLREIFNALLFVFFSKKYTGVSFSILKQFRDFIPGIIILLPVTFFALFYNNYSFWLISFIPVSFGAYIYMVWKKIMIHEEKVWVIGYIRRFLKK